MRLIERVNTDWINVKMAMPVQPGDYIVVIVKEDDIPEVITAYYDNIVIAFKKGNEIINDQVLYWSHLPKMPESVNIGMRMFKNSTDKKLVDIPKGQKL